MKKTLCIITMFIFSLASVAIAQDEPLKTKDQVKLTEQAKDKTADKDMVKTRTKDQDRIKLKKQDKVKDGDKVQAKDQARIREQDRLKKNEKITDSKGETEKNALKNGGEGTKIKASNREKNRNKKALKKEAREQKKEMRENKKAQQEMNKGGKGR